MTDEALAQELEQATAGLEMMSEPDYPFKVIRWDDTQELTPEQLRRESGGDATAPVAERDLDDLFQAATSEPE